MTAIGILAVLLAAANAVFLGWLGNRGVRTWREEEHVSFMDLKVLGQETRGEEPHGAGTVSDR